MATLRSMVKYLLISVVLVLVAGCCIAGQVAKTAPNAVKNKPITNADQNPTAVPRTEETSPAESTQCSYSLLQVWTKEEMKAQNLRQAGLELAGSQLSTGDTNMTSVRMYFERAQRIHNSIDVPYCNEKISKAHSLLTQVDTLLLSSLDDIENGKIQRATGKINEAGQYMNEATGLLAEVAKEFK